MCGQHETYPAFSVAAMDMWCSSVSGRDEAPCTKTGGADSCSVVADTPATCKEKNILLYVESKIRSVMNSLFLRN